MIVCGPDDLKDGRSGRAGRAVQHSRHVLDQLDPAVEGAAVHHVEGNVGVAVIDPFLAGGASDDREHHHPEPVDKAGYQQRAATGRHSPSSPAPHRPDRR